MNALAALSELDAATATKKLSVSAADNIRRWLTEPRYAEYAPQVAEHIAAGKWKELDDVFWTVIPFGTGGRRGKMYPIGCNAINDRTIGESAQGLADYVRVQGSGFRVQGGGSGVRGRESGDSERAPGNSHRGAQYSVPSTQYEPARGDRHAAANPQSAIRNPQSAPSEPRTLNPEPPCAIAYDTRHNSRRFAELCGSVMVANGFRVFFLDGFRSTPELSFLVRYKQCACGIMVTASHNPPSDNAVKVYWSTGGQVIPPHDRGIVERVMNVEEIQRVDFAQAVADGRIVFCQEEVDAAFTQNVLSQRCPGPRDLKIVYSPLHGVGEFAVVPVLKADGFADIEIFGPHREPNGDFPNVPGHVSNPENPAVFDAIVERARSILADVALATDPDCDRLGCAAPRTRNRTGEWGTFTGNQLCGLLTDFVCEQRKKAGGLTRDHFVVTTLVTTPLVRRIATSYGIQTRDNVHVGFKWIAAEIDKGGPDKFVFGTEESHGFLIGQYLRDKDGAAAAMLMAELAAQVKASGKTLFERLESLYWQHGYHGDRAFNLFMAGSAGMARMQALMQRFRASPPASLGGLAVRQVRDYQSLTVKPLSGASGPLDAEAADMVILDLAAEGHFVAVRPSGTEPKVKFYLFAFVPAEQLHLLDETRREIDQRLFAIEADLRAVADEV
jgi:phosphoglucomutase/phosphomannomutase